ncbi:MAG: hypothetical protein KJ749_05345, partial [Planctomycetes bacterium]|nr:hypothetical protein [Planctomycetota bacterium]
MTDCNTGIGYVFERDGLAWPEVVDPYEDPPLPKPIRPGSLGSRDEFGKAVAISGEVIVAGARLHEVSTSTDAGAVYVFRRDAGGNWLEEKTLTAMKSLGGGLVGPDLGASDEFGTSVAVDGDVIVVGSPQNDDFMPPGGTGNSGSAYVYRYVGGVWEWEAKLLASDANQEDYFGESVAISGDWIVVGAHLEYADGVEKAGSVYVFHYNPVDGWQGTQKLTAQLDTGESDIGAQDKFGGVLSLAGDRLIVGAASNDDACPSNVSCNSGSAYVYRREDSTWVIEQKLRPDNNKQADSFGESVGINGDMVIVGANKTDLAGSSSGSAYLYRRQGTTWVEVEELVAGDAGISQFFGGSSAIGAEYAIAGSYKGKDPTDIVTGAAYVFRVAVGDNDCQPNGVADDCDIINGTSLDITGNGTPDECECTGDGDCDDHLTCTVNSCNQATKLCEVEIDPGFCLIGGECYDYGTFNPDNQCEVCKDTVSQEAWSPMPAGFTCGDPSTAGCNASDTCDGMGVCKDNVQPANTPCRGAAGGCDVAEVCNGISTDCPADKRVAAGTACRAAVDECDIAEACDGVSTACPGDVYQPDDTSCTDNGLYCDGNETCQGGACTSGPARCRGDGRGCNEAEDRCVCTSDDGCPTLDCRRGTCNLGSGNCEFVVDAGQCAIDDVCYDDDTVNPLNECEVCDADADQLAWSFVVGSCTDDGNECTDDVCLAGVCTHPDVTNGTVCTDDGLHCTGEETCQAGACTSGPAPCTEAGRTCDEDNDKCKCLSNEGCPNLECRTGSCNLGTGECVYNIDPASCSIADVCYDNGDRNPANECEKCDSAVDQEAWTALTGIACTGDGNECTSDLCAAGVCAHSNLANDTSCTDDGLRCNGADSSCQGGVCTASGDDPCEERALVCFEAQNTDKYVCGCNQNSQCADGLFCTKDDLCVSSVCVNSGNPCSGTTPKCDEANNVCLCSGSSCDDGVFCNGVESCSAAGACVAGTNPCGTGQQCDEQRNRCIACLVAADCSDGDACTIDTCDDGTCKHTKASWCEDDDEDGVMNQDDDCANTATGQAVDVNGCSCAQRDSDADGVDDCRDECADTPSDEEAGFLGCSCSQLDDDEDGVDNCLDLCPDTPEDVDVDDD